MTGNLTVKTCIGFLSPTRVIILRYHFIGYSAPLGIFTSQLEHIFVEFGYI